MEINYKEKYLKYKKKYLDLKKNLELQHGGDFFNQNEKYTDNWGRPISSAAYNAAKLVTKTTAATAEFAANTGYRKFKCLVNLSTVGQQEKQNEIKKYILEILKKDIYNTIKNILTNKIVENNNPFPLETDGIKLSKVDRFKDNISLLIQAYKQILGSYNGVIMNGEKSLTSYQSYDNINKVIAALREYGPLPTENDVTNLEYIRGMVDCYCKSIVNWTDDAQVNKLEQCLPNDFFNLNWENPVQKAQLLQEAKRLKNEGLQEQRLQAQQLQAQQLQAQQLQAQQLQAQQLQAQPPMQQLLFQQRVKNPVLGQSPPGLSSLKPPTPPPFMQKPVFSQPMPPTPPPFIQKPVFSQPMQERFPPMQGQVPFPPIQGQFVPRPFQSQRY